MRLHRRFLGKLFGPLILAVVGLGLSLPQVVLAADPSVNVVAPSNEFGDAGAALGNVWDMNSVNDVVWKQPDASGRTIQFSLQQAGDAGVPTDAYGKVLKGVTPKGSDLATVFYANASVSIPSQTYRYLIYRASIAPHQSGEGGIEITNARLLYSSRWGSNWLSEAFPYRRYSNPQRVQECPAPAVYGKWCTYFVDLAQNINGPGSPNPWDWGQSGARVEAFGIWAHENWCNSTCGPSGDSPNYFHLDFVYLTGEIVAKSPTYDYSVRWNVADADGGQVTSKLYYQEQNELLPPAQSPACNAANVNTAWNPVTNNSNDSSINVPGSPSAVRIFLPVIIKGNVADNNPFGSGQVGPFNQSFTWDLSAGAYTAGKVYYVCVEVEDSQGNKSYAVSSAPVIKAPQPTVLNPFGAPDTQSHPN
ncbi:MAG: hypothetical protein HC875_37770 [Anaerolineales bacterium]|nr:hypothetical protein [Anaerolineales bacterium]